MSIDLNNKYNNTTWRMSNSDEYKFKRGSYNDIANNLDIIYKHLKDFNKQVNYWDIYRFSTSLTDATKFEEEFLALSPNNSMVINCSNFVYNGDAYTRGDVVVKSDRNEEIHIKTEAQGLFYPAEKIDGNVLKYKYASNIESIIANSGSNSITWEKEENGDVVGKIELSGLTYDATYSKVWYLRNVEYLSGAYTLYTEGNYDNIPPVVKCYIETDESGSNFEELYVPIKLTNFGSYWGITITLSEAVGEKTVMMVK